MRSLDVARPTARSRRVALAIGALGLVAIAFAACSDNPSVSRPPDGPGPQPAPFESSSAGGSLTCASSTDCAQSIQYCEDPNGTCAADGGIAYCVPTPSSCGATTDVSVCGCDGMVYPSACLAAQAGTDVAKDAASCSLASPNFACGDVVCDASAGYCRRSPPVTAGGADVYTCIPYPGPCFGQLPTTTCACVTGEPCEASCKAQSLAPWNALFITCT